MPCCSLLRLTRHADLRFWIRVAEPLVVAAFSIAPSALTSAESLRSWPATIVADWNRSQTGPVVHLPLPRPTWVWFKSTKIRVGSTTEERTKLTSLCGHEMVPDACLEHLARSLSMPRIVEVPAFRLDRTETTLEAYRECLRANACPAVPDPLLESPTDDRLPVAYVDRAAAQAYCRFRGGRLPRRTEFERAARNDSIQLFPWGDLYNSAVSNHGRFAPERADATDGFADRAPVGSFASGATQLRVLDLSGNVSEWVDDNLQADAERVAAGAPSPGVVCGGDYLIGSVGLAAGSCISVDPRHRLATIGFRCAYDRESKSQQVPVAQTTLGDWPATLPNGAG